MLSLIEQLKCHELGPYFYLLLFGVLPIAIVYIMMHLSALTLLICGQQRSIIAHCDNGKLACHIVMLSFKNLKIANMKRRYYLAVHCYIVNVLINDYHLFDIWLLLHNVQRCVNFLNPI